MTTATAPLGLFPDPQKPRLDDRAVSVLRTAHDARRTPKASVHWQLCPAVGRLAKRPQDDSGGRVAGAHCGSRSPRPSGVGPALSGGLHFVLRPRHPPKAIRQAARRSDLRNRVTAPTFRHSFATHRIESGSDIRTVQELPGHNDVRTTMICTHLLNRGGRGIRSPADFDDFLSESRPHVIPNQH